MKKYFRPKENITAYEVAYILGHLTSTHWDVGFILTVSEWDEIPEPMKRHLSDTP